MPSCGPHSRSDSPICQQTDADPETGCMEFDIEKGRFSFRLTAPYNTALKKRLLAYSRRYPAKRRNLPRAISREVWYNFFEKVLDLM